MKKLWIVVLVVVLAVLGWFVFKKNYANAPADMHVDESGTSANVEGTNGNSADETSTTDTIVQSGTAVISYNGKGFSPNTVNVKAGTVVEFKNDSSVDFWPASAVHPTHTVYPGSNISLCGTADALTIFDACGAVAPGGSYSFTFDEVGTWHYHNHLQASQTGTIVVTE